MTSDILNRLPWLRLDFLARGVTVPRTLPTRRDRRIGAVLAGTLVLLAAAGCGSGGSGGGGEGSADDLAGQAAAVGALLDQVEALSTSATTAEEFSAQLAPLQEQIQGLIEQVQETSAPEELSSRKEQLANGLRGLRTQLGRVEGLLAAGDLEGAQTAIEGSLAIAQTRQAITAIEAAAPASP